MLNFNLGQVQLAVKSASTGGTRVTAAVASVASAVANATTALAADVIAAV